MVWELVERLFRGEVPDPFARAARLRVPLQVLNLLLAGDGDPGRAYRREAERVTLALTPAG